MELPYRFLRWSSIAAPTIDYAKYLKPAQAAVNVAPPQAFKEKYQLLGFIIEYWMFYTRRIENSSSELYTKLQDIARYKCLSFEFRPWGPNQHYGRYGCTSCTPGTPASQLVAKSLPFMSLLHYAAEVGHWPLMEPLVDDYCAHENGHDTTLVIACSNGHLSIVERLMQGYAFDLFNGNAMNAAAACGHEQIFIHLLETTSSRHDSFVLINQLLHRALVHASANGHEAIVEILCQRGAQIYARYDESHGISALSAAASNGHDHVVRLLLAKGARVLTTGTTPLHCAAEKGHDVVVRTLLDDNVEYDPYNLGKFS